MQSSIGPASSARVRAVSVSWGWAACSAVAEPALSAVVPASVVTELVVVPVAPSALPTSAREGAANPTSSSPPVSIPTAVSLRPNFMVLLLKAGEGRFLCGADLVRWVVTGPKRMSELFPRWSRSNRAHEPDGEDEKRQH